MNQDAVLERLYVELLAKTDGLEAALKGATQAARDAVKEMEAAAAATGQSVGADLAAGFNVARESTGQFTRDLTAGMRQAGAGTEQIARDITQLNARMRENHEAVRAGEQSREQYRQTLQGQRQQLQTLITEYNRAARGLGEYDQAISGAVSENRELDDTIASLGKQVRLQRALWAGRITDDQQLKDSTAALQVTMRELLETAELSEDQMLKLGLSYATAQRQIDSANNVASRGGLAWTAQIGIADAFGNSLRSLGPAGNAAAGGLRIAQSAFQAFGGPLDLTNINIQGLLKSISRLTIALPLLGAAAGVAAVGGLWRMNAAAAEMATELEVAAHRTGLSVEALQEYHYAAEQAGIGTERFNTVAQRLLRRAADAQAGSKGLAEAFNTLGVSVTGADGKLRSAEELLGDVADGLFRVENQGERVALAFRLMDTDGSIMLNFLSAGSEGLAAMRQEARELGLVISGDTIMTLSEFGNQVSEIKRQFEVARTEIAAAFLPVLQESVIPFIQDVVIPWLHGAANQVMEFADSFTEIGGAGADFRADMLRNMQAVIEFGRTVGVVVQSAVGAFQTIAAVGGAVGGFIAGAADAEWMADRRAVLDAQISFLEEQLEQANLAADARRAIVQELNDARMELADLPANWWESAVQGMDFGWDYFFSGAVDSFSGALDLLERDLEGEISSWLTNTFAGSADRTGARNFGADLADGVADGITSGLTAQAQSLSDVVAKMQRDVATAAQREAHNIAAGMDEATAEAIRLGEELTVVTNAYNTLLTGDFDASDSLLMQLRQQAEDLQTALDNLPGPATATAWTSRLQLELELGVKEPQEVIDILTPRLQELIAERDELLEGGAYNTQAFKDLTADIDVLTKTVDAATNMLPELPEAAEAAGTGIDAAFQRAAAAANEALKGVTSEMTSVFAGVGDFAADNLEFEEAARLARLLGQEFDPLATRLQIVGNRIRDLNSRFHELNPLERMWLNNLQAEHAQLQQQQAAVEQYTQRLDALVDTLGGFADRVRGTLAEVFSGVGDFAADNLAFEEAERVARALGQEFDELTTRLSINESTIRRLHSNYDELSATQLMYLANLEAETAELQALLAAREREAEAAELSALRTAEAAAAAEQTTESYESLLATINEFGEEQDPFDQFRAQLKELAATGHLTGQEVADALNAIREARERMNAAAEDARVNELKTEWAGLRESVEELTGSAPSEFDVLRASIQEVADALREAGEDAEHLDEMLDALDAAEAANNLVGTLGTVRGAFQQIGSAAGGAAGEAITGIGDMIDIAMKFASGDVAGAVIDVFAEIVRAISEVINANENWRRTLDDLAARNKMLSKDVTDAITVSRDETVRLWGWLPIGTKKVVKQAATDQAIGWANAFANAAASALASTDLFGNLELGLDRIVRDELIRGFTQSAAMSAAIIEVVQLFQQAWEEQDPVMRDQLLLQGRAAFAGLEEEFEEFWNWLQETFPDLYELGASSAGSFASGFQNALQSADFTADFDLGLDKLIRDEMIRGFMDSAVIQEGLKAAQEAFAEGNFEEARAHLESLRNAGEEFWQTLQEEFPDLYEELKAEEAARAAEELAAALQDSADAAADLWTEIHRGELERAFATGAIDLQAYLQSLLELADQEAALDREREQRSLDERRRKALEAAETEEERQRVLDQFDEEQAALDASVRERIAAAEADAINAVKSILGVTTDGLISTIRSAFDVTAFSDFTESFRERMTDVIRNSLITGFLHSSVIKPLLDDLGDMIMTAILEGTMEASLGAIEEQIDLIVDVSEEFWNFLEDLGFGFRDLTGETDRLSESIASATEQMLNVPSLFKFTQATWSAAPVAPGWAGGGFAGAQQSVTNETHVHVTVHAGDVVGINDFEQFVTDTVKTGVNQSNLATAGLGTGGGRDW